VDLPENVSSRLVFLMRILNAKTIVTTGSQQKEKGGF